MHAAQSQAEQTTPPNHRPTENQTLRRTPNAEKREGNEASNAHPLPLPMEPPKPTSFSLREVGERRAVAVVSLSQNCTQPVCKKSEHSQTRILAPLVNLPLMGSRANDITDFLNCLNSFLHNPFLSQSPSITPRVRAGYKNCILKQQALIQMHSMSNCNRPKVAYFGGDCEYTSTSIKKLNQACTNTSTSTSTYKFTT